MPTLCGSRLVDAAQSSHEAPASTVKTWHTQSPAGLSYRADVAFALCCGGKLTGSLGLEKRIRSLRLIEPAY